MFIHKIIGEKWILNTIESINLNLKIQFYYGNREDNEEGFYRDLFRNSNLSSRVQRLFLLSCFPQIRVIARVQCLVNTMKSLSIIFFLFVSGTVFGQRVFEIDSEVRENSIIITRTAQDMISKQNYIRAADILEGVMRTDPSFHAAYVNYYNSAKNIPAKIPDLIQSLQKALEIFEQDDELAYYLGNIFQSEKRFPEAIKAYSEAIAFSKINGEDYPIVWAYHFNRGNCFLKTNQHLKAIPDYTYALQLSPDNPDILTNRGFSLLKTDQKQRACQDWVDAKNFGSKDTPRYLQTFCK